MTAVSFAAEHEAPEQTAQHPSPAASVLSGLDPAAAMNIGEQTREHEQRCQALHPLDDVEHRSQIDRSQRPGCCNQQRQRLGRYHPCRHARPPLLKDAQQRPQQQEHEHHVAHVDDHVRQFHRKRIEPEQVPLHRKAGHGEGAGQRAGTAGEGSAQHLSEAEIGDPDIVVVDDVGKIVERIPSRQPRPIDQQHQQADQREQYGGAKQRHVGVLAGIGVGEVCSRPQTE
jgi:hypothetical protein